MPSLEKTKKIDGFDEWEVRGAANTLVEAERIKNNPKLLKAAKKIASENAIATNEAVTSINQAMKQAGKTRKKQERDQQRAKKIYG